MSQVGVRRGDCSLHPVFVAYLRAREYGNAVKQHADPASPVSGKLCAEEVPPSIWARILRSAVDVSPWVNSIAERLDPEALARLIQVLPLCSRSTSSEGRVLEGLLLLSLNIWAVLQLAVVHSTWASAAGETLQLWGLSCHNRLTGAQPSLQSKLLIKWAKQLKDLRLSGKCHTTPGMMQFLTAAQQVTNVWVSGGAPSRSTSWLRTAAYDCMLAHLESVTHLQLSGALQLCVLPVTLVSLPIYCDPYKLYGVEEIGAATDAVLYRAKRLPVLKELSLSCCNVYTNQPLVFSIKCPVQLGSLERLNLSIALVEFLSLDLSWLQHQQHCKPLRHLHLCVYVRTPKPVNHAAFLQQLAGVPITSLHLQLEAPFHVGCQALWNQFSVQTLKVYCNNKFQFSKPRRKLSGSGNSQPPPAFPHSTHRLSIEFAPCNAADSIFIDWDTIAKPNVELLLLPHQELHILGASKSSLLQQPWQITILGTSKVHGLPACHVSGNTYTMQSFAAH